MVPIVPILPLSKHNVIIFASDTSTGEGRTPYFYQNKRTPHVHSIYVGAVIFSATLVLMINPV